MSENKKAIVVGGSNGIGLSITNELVRRGYFVYIMDIVEPEVNELCDGSYCKYIYCNLLDFDEELFKKYVCDKNIDTLMITAGIGRVADFEYIHLAEIDKLIKLNTIAGIKIIKLFYERIKCIDKFYCGVMGSIAGIVSSPMFSVYAASKAAICRFIESVNVELKVGNSANRILNVSPGSIKGTRFNGGENNLELTSSLAKGIVDNLFDSKEIYIPEYEAVYKGVIDRYREDADKFGISSYNYKKESGRVVNENKASIGYLSGTFDLFHVGHLNLLKRAKKECDYLIVGVHPDASHKGKETFIPFEERMQIIEGCKYVDKVVPSCPEDSDAWDLWHYTKLFVGSDYKGTERFSKYEELFKDKNVEIIYFPYTQGTSSTQIRDKIKGSKLE